MGKPISTVHGDKRLCAVRSRVYVLSSPHLTFHDFCIRMVTADFGDEWYQEERLKPEKERHAVATWYISYCAETECLLKEKGQGLIASPASGDVWSLITLGYDLYSVLQNMELPDKLMSRLKSRDGFQGARYELAVAAIFARAFFDITFLDRKSKTHWEFNAKYNTAGETVAVEATSRHRSGVLHEPGKQLSLDEIKVGITAKLNKALKQKPKDLPFVVFIDLNLPPIFDIPYPKRKWFQDLKKAISSQGVLTPDNPEDYSLLVVTNFFHHYAGTDIVGVQKDSSDLCVVVPKYARIPFKDRRTFEAIHLGVSVYGNVPHNW